MPHAMVDLLDEKGQKPGVVCIRFLSVTNRETIRI